LACSSPSTLIRFLSERCPCDLWRRRSIVGEHDVPAVALGNALQLAALIFGCAKPETKSHAALLRLNVRIAARAPGRRDNRRLARIRRRHFHFAIDVRRADHPLVCPSLSLSVWLPRSRSVYAFGSEFCAKTEKPAANATAIAAAAKYFGYLPTRIERCRDLPAVTESAN
jgi:hypothetical protein